MNRVITDAESVEALAAEWPEQRPVSDDPFMRDPLEAAIDNHVDGYTMEGDDSYHQPTEGERAMIKDAIMGLLADTEWDRLWGEHIQSLVANRTAALAGRVRELEAALWGCIAAIERTHHCTEADRLAAADNARAALTTPESNP